MKIGIVGTGLVGSTAAYAMVMRGVGREIVMVDINQKRAQAEADDIFHAVPFAHSLEVRAGEYADLANSRVVVLAAGVSMKPGESRLQLLERNAAIFADVVPKVLQHAPDAVLLVATNPVDIMTHLAARYAGEHGVPPNRVIGSGTTLDTARFRVLLGRHLAVDSQHIHGYVVGEHGDSEVVLDEAVQQEIDHRVRDAAYAIVDGKGSTYYGIGAALARITDAILKDQRAILTICTPVAEILGVCDVTISLPHLLGADGVVESFPLPLNTDEQAQLQASAQVVCEAIEALDATAAG
jgi:L-lactate dehydrogenase